MKDQPEREAELIRLTGALIREWATTEWMLFMLTSALLGCDFDRARIVWNSATNFRTKRDLLSRLGRSFLADRYLPALESMMKQAKHLSEKRNMLAHDRAYYMGKGVFRFMNDSEPTQPNTFGRYRDVPLANIAIWAKEMNTLAGDVMNFSTQISLVPDALIPMARVLPADDD